LTSRCRTNKAVGRPRMRKITSPRNHWSQTFTRAGPTLEPILDALKAALLGGGVGGGVVRNGVVVGNEREKGRREREEREGKWAHWIRTRLEERGMQSIKWHRLKEV